eukprot:gene8431-8614_t
MIAYFERNYYWSHGLNAGGAFEVSNKGKLRYPAGRYGMCGDAAWESKWDQPGPVQAEYSEGQVIQIDILIAVNHVGRMDMTVCDLDAKVGQDSKCHQLQR